jgi:hypothetical protein
VYAAAGRASGHSSELSLSTERAGVWTSYLDQLSGPAASEASGTASAAERGLLRLQRAAAAARHIPAVSLLSDADACRVPWGRGRLRSPTDEASVS